MQAIKYLLDEAQETFIRDEGLQIANTEVLQMFANSNQSLITLHLEITGDDGNVYPRYLKFDIDEDSCEFVSLGDFEDFAEHNDDISAEIDI